MITLRLLGGVSLRDQNGMPVEGGSTQRHRLALLALLAAARSGALTRDKLIAYLWPERDTATARHLLSVSLSVLRKGLGSGALGTAGDEVSLDARLVWVDTRSFEAALENGRFEEAVHLYAGPFLDGFFLPGAEEFERWVGRERKRFADLYAGALESLADAAAERGDLPAACGWWRQRAAHEPHNSRVALRLMEALEAAGDRTGAIRHAAVHQALHEETYGAGPDPAVAALADRVRVAVAAPSTASPPTEPEAKPAAEPLRTDLQPTGASHTPPATAAAPLRPLWWVAAAMVVVGLSVGAWVLASGASGSGGRPVTPGAELIALLPFSTSGAALDGSGQAFAELLASNLSQLDEVRIVRPQGALPGTSAGAADLRQALAAGRAAGAASVLTGSVASAGAGLRIQAQLHRVTGERLAAVQADGPADSVLVLVDRLTMALVREIWRAREPVPNLRIDAITTASVEAARAYLRGERFRNAAQWDSAVVAFEEAVRIDTTFALAYYRLSESHSWRAGLVSRGAQRHLEAALRHEARLPPRERAILGIRRQHQEGDVAAADSVWAPWQRYPNDPDLHYLRADLTFHVAMLLGGDRQHLYELFDGAIQLNPRSGPVYLHPLDLAFVFGDRPRFERYLAGFAASVDADEVRPWAAAGRIRWAEPEVSRQRYIQTFPDEPPGATRALGALLRASYGADPPRPDLFLEALDFSVAAAPTVPMRRLPPSAERAIALVGLGRLAAARAPLDSLLDSHERTTARMAQLAPVLLGFAPEGFVRPQALTAPVTPNPAEQLYLRALLALNRRDIEGGRRLLAAAVEVDTVDGSLFRRGLARAAHGWAAVLAGDTTAGVSEMEAGLRAAGYGDDALYAGVYLRLHLARLQALRPGTRHTGILRLRWHLAHSTALLHPLLTLWLAESLDAAGEDAEARRLYARFAALWAEADPELQPLVEQARRRAQAR